MPEVQSSDLQYVRNCIDGEGFEYAFRSYSSFQEVKDPEFHRLRQAYKAAADALEKYVNERTVGEGDEDEFEEEE